MSYQPCFTAPSDLASGKRELLPELLAALPTIRPHGPRDRNSSRFKRRARFSVQLKHRTQGFASYADEGRCRREPAD